MKLLIMCQAGANRYAMDSRHVSEVLPRLNLHGVSGSPPWLAGLLICRGEATPVVDLVQLTEGRSCPNRLSSRIVVLRTELDGVVRRFGILAEQVGLREVGAVQSLTGDQAGGTTGLGRILLDENGVFQLLDPASLVAQDRESFLFSAVEGQGSCP